MPFTPFDFDESVTQTEPGRPHVPQGYYLLTKARMEPTPEDFEKTTGVFTTLRFKEGPSHAPDAGKGREIREYSSLGGGKKNGRGTQFGFGMLLGAFGFAGVAKKLAGKTIQSYEEFKNLIEVIDRKVGDADIVALIADDTNSATNRVFSSLVEFYPASEWPSLKSAMVSSPMVGPRVQQANGATPPAAPTPAAMDALTKQAMALFEDVQNV